MYLLHYYWAQQACKNGIDAYQLSHLNGMLNGRPEHSSGIWSDCNSTQETHLKDCLYQPHALTGFLFPPFLDNDMEVAGEQLKGGEWQNISWLPFHLNRPPPFFLTAHTTRVSGRFFFPCMQQRKCMFNHLLTSWITNLTRYCQKYFMPFKVQWITRAYVRR